MFSTGSFLETASIYLVENVVQSALALLVVLVVIRLLGVRDAALRVHFLLLPLVLPLLGPPTYYFLFPSRQEMPVLGVDRLLDVEGALRALDLAALSPLLSAVALSGLALSLAGAGLSLLGVLYLPRRYASLARGRSQALDQILESVARRAAVRPPLVLMSPGAICGTGGLVRPYLVVSAGLLAALERPALEAVVAHEMAHLRRRDNLLWLLVMIIRNVLCFNPIVLYLSRQILLEAEKACDRLALSFGLAPSTYAQSLLKVWRLGSEPSARLERLLCGFAPPTSRFRERIIALYAEGAAIPRLQRGAFWLTAAFLAVGLFFLC